MVKCANFLQIFGNLSYYERREIFRHSFENIDNCDVSIRWLGWEIGPRVESVLGWVLPYNLCQEVGNFFVNFQVIDLGNKIVVIGVLAHPNLAFILFSKQWFTVYVLIFSLFTLPNLTWTDPTDFVWNNPIRPAFLASRDNTTQWVVMAVVLYNQIWIRKNVAGRSYFLWQILLEWKQKVELSVVQNFRTMYIFASGLILQSSLIMCDLASPRYSV